MARITHEMARHMLRDLARGPYHLPTDTLVEYINQQEASDGELAGNAAAVAPLFALLREMISQVTAGPIVRREQREAFGYALQACERFFGCPELAAVNHRPFADRLEELRRAGGKEKAGG